MLFLLSAVFSELRLSILLQYSYHPVSMFINYKSETDHQYKDTKVSQKNHVIYHQTHMIQYNYRNGDNQVPSVSLKVAEPQSRYNKHMNQQQ